MINNPSVDASPKTTRIGRAIWTALQTQSSNHAKNFITKIIKEENARALEAGQDITKFAVGVCIKVPCGYILSNMFITNLELHNVTSVLFKLRISP